MGIFDSFREWSLSVFIRKAVKRFVVIAAAFLIARVPTESGVQVDASAFSEWLFVTAWAAIEGLRNFVKTKTGASWL